MLRWKQRLGECERALRNSVRSLWQAGFHFRNHRQICGVAEVAFNYL